MPPRVTYFHRPGVGDYEEEFAALVERLCYRDGRPVARRLRQLTALDDYLYDVASGDLEEYVCTRQEWRRTPDDWMLSDTLYVYRTATDPFVVFTVAADGEGPFVAALWCGTLADETELALSGGLWEEITWRLRAWLNG